MELSPRTQAEAALRNPATVQQIMSMLPLRDRASKERFVTNLQMIARTNNKLAECEVKSLLDACFDAARLGLEVNSPLHEAVILPRTKKGGGVAANLQIEYRGLVNLMRRSGKLRNVATGIVRRDDTYRRTATGFEFECDPFASEDDRGPIVGAYCVLDMEDGTRQVETMSRAQIEHVRAKSRAAHDGPWVSDWEEMARKTVLRRAAKLVPWSAEEAAQIEIADRTEFAELDAEVEVHPPPAPTRGPRAVLEKLRPAVEDDEEPEDDHEAAPQRVQVARDEGEDPPKPSVDPGASERPSRGATGRLPLGREAPLHAREAAQLAQTLSLPQWERLTAGRQQLIQRAVDASGLPSVGLWRAVDEYVAAMSEEEYQGLKSLEQVLDGYAAQHEAGSLPGVGG